MSLRAISPNQFALPGMEHQAHAGAPYLPHGVMFHMEHEKDDDGVFGHSLSAHDKGGSFDPEEDHHAAHRLSWSAGGKDASYTTGNYPGEITWVGRAWTDAARNGMSQRGIMAAMHHLGHTLDMGQTTVPVHSPDRTDDGERWARKVGPAHLTPQRNDYNWTPPQGTHPFQQQAEAEYQARPKRAGSTQGMLLPYMEGEAPPPPRKR